MTRRVQALLRTPPAVGTAHLLAPVAVLAVTVALTIGASRDLEGLFELAMRVWAH